MVLARREPIAAVVDEELGPAGPSRPSRRRRRSRRRADRSTSVAKSMAASGDRSRPASSAPPSLAPVRVHAADQRLGDHVVGVADVGAAELGEACDGRASARSPAARARSPRRRRPRRSRPGRTGWPGAGAARVISGVSSAKPKWVQTKSNAPWPSGWMWRVETQLTCCWKITLGKSVVITAVGPPHQGSGTMSRKRGSLSCMSSLKLDTCVTCSALPACAAGRDHRRVAVARVHQQLRLVVGAPEAEGDEPGVQQARVVRVLDVLLHQLPVARDALAVVAEES